ncbi:hypothetical protein QQ054_19260 [Oscillatoria amoena NRMC-F 0135]|nr:hypothetical protein [Oscillatoria amoena NRMC-F 0135]
MKSIFYISIVVLTQLLQSCCSPDEKIEDPCGQACLPEEECDNGQCVCAFQPSIKVGYECVRIGSNTYYAKIDCDCLKEIAIDIRKLAPNFPAPPVYRGYKASNIYYNIPYFSDSVMYGEYYKNNQTDSFLLYDIIRPLCKKNGKEYHASLAGKFISSDTIDAWIKWHQTPINVPPTFLPPIDDSCHLYLIKPKI